VSCAVRTAIGAAQLPSRGHAATNWPLVKRCPSTPSREAAGNGWGTGRARLDNGPKRVW
jgi:hypothetical protein